MRSSRLAERIVLGFLMLYISEVDNVGSIFVSILIRVPYQFPFITRFKEFEESLLVWSNQVEETLLVFKQHIHCVV